MSWIGSFQQLLTANGLEEWLSALLTFLVVLFALYFAKRILVGRFVAMAARTKTQIDDVLATALSKTKFYFLFVVALWIGLQALAQIPPDLGAVIKGLTVLVAFFQVGIWANSILIFVVRHFVRLEIEDEASQVATTTALTSS